ncbi:MAG: Spx/MgsR family RNA polymerase-binding regulatory protein [Ferruginibacter sp.]
MSTIIIYGIPNCDAVKKTLDWFKKHKKTIVFYNYKKESISKEKLTAWCKQLGWEILLNKKSTTWRGLSADKQTTITTQAAAIKLMQANTSIIKRPIIEFGNHLLVGFDEKQLIAMGLHF